jgi:hypothetical protein
MTPYADTNTIAVRSTISAMATAPGKVLRSAVAVDRNAPRADSIGRSGAP